MPGDSEFCEGRFQRDGAVDDPHGHFDARRIADLALRELGADPLNLRCPCGSARLVGLDQSDLGHVELAEDVVHDRLQQIDRGNLGQSVDFARADDVERAPPSAPRESCRAAATRH